MLNSRLCSLIDKWIFEGSEPQESFDTSMMRVKWINKFPSEKHFLKQLPNLIGRSQLREICKVSSVYNSLEKFLAVMVWGYGNRGYGPFRVQNIVLQSVFEKIIRQVIELANNSLPKEAYALLSREKLYGLGPSYGTKLISFCTPREISAPILDSYILNWISEWAQTDLLKNRKVPKSWNLDFYHEYSYWIEAHSKKFLCYPDDVELVLFRDAENSQI